MIAAILNSAMLDSDTAILDSDTLLSSLRFTQKHSHSTLTLTQTKSIWLTWWWQPSWILPSWIQPFYTKLWLKLFQSDSNSFILTQCDDGSHLEFGHLGFSHLSISSQTHSHVPRLVPTICTKKLHSFILSQLDDSSHIEFYHVEFRYYPLGFRHLVISSQIHSKTLSLHSDSDSNLFNLINLMMAAILNSAIFNSAILDSAILHKTLTQTNSIWLKLIHSHSTWWWQPSWIQPFCRKKTLLIYSHSCYNGSHLEFSHLGLSHFAQNKLYSFILTQLDDGSHLEFYHLKFGQLIQPS